MAGAKKSKSSEATTMDSRVTARALEHGRDACGAKFVKEGVGLTADDDLAFALGWPHVTYLAEGGDDADGTLAAAAGAVPTTRESAGLAEFPSGVAARLARLLAVGIYRDASDNVMVEYQGKSLAAPGPLGVDEAAEALKKQIESKQLRSFEHEEAFLFEAVLGPNDAAEALVRAFEALDPGAVASRNVPGDLLARALGLILLRARGDVAAELRKRVGAVVERAGRSAAEFQSPLRVLDAIVNGAAAFEQHKMVSSRDLLLLPDAPEYVRKHVLAAGVDATFVAFPRLVFLGGDEVLAHYAKHWRKMKDAADVRRFVRGIGAMRSAGVLPLMLELSSTSKAKKEAAQWFIDHAAHTRAFLEKTASGAGEAAAWAAPLLKKLPKA